MRILQTFVLPDNLVARYKLSFAAANFSRNLLSGGGFDKCFSLMPVNVKGELPRVQEDGYEVVYSKWRKNARLLSRLAIFMEQLYIFKQVHKGDSLWLYNLNVINALLFILVKFLKPSVKLNVIILDFTPAVSWSEQNYWYLKLINMADGAISLSYSDLFKCKNISILPGVVPSTAGSEPIIKKLNNKYLLSGVLLEEIAQTSMILEAFSKLPQCELHITGKIDNDEKIKRYADTYENIVWHGSVLFSEYLSILHDCSFVLSTRDPQYPENQCNFPSKIIESLLHNRIIISTISYKQLDGIKYFKTSSDIEFFKQHIKSISALGEGTLREYANQGKKVKEMFSTMVWNDTIKKIEQKR